MLQSCGDEIDRPFRLRDVLAGNLQADLQPADLEIVAGDIGNDGDQNRVAQVDLCLGIINCGFERALEFAEQIELP